METIIILFVLTIHGTWESLEPPPDEPIWADLSACTEWADTHVMGNGKYKDAWVCFYPGDPYKAMFPPYDWPKLITSGDECNTPTCVLEASRRERYRIPD